VTPKPVKHNKNNDSGLLEELDESDDSWAQSPGLLRIAQDNLLHVNRALPEINKMISLIKNPNLAIIIVDSNLTVMYSTPKTELMFKDYYTISPKPFFNIFTQTLDQIELADLITSLKSKERGYCWTGTLKHKKPTTTTMHTRTNFVPFFAENNSVAGFQVLFDDITKGYYEQLRGTFNSILEAAKLKDNDTGMHNERVSYYSRKMSEYLYTKQIYPQIDPDFIENIGFLAAMHDVGKIGTPDYILQKPGKLTDLEWDIMREHTINGTFILSSYPVPMAREIALSHHEWWNGSGYPFRLEGKMITLPARIVTIADVYDALRMKRTYKNEFTHEETVARIVAGSGTQFDPELVEIFERIQADFNDIWNLLRDTESHPPSDHDRSKEISESF